jgi:multidrug transporter EmrE-like cation transporter
MNQFNTFNGLIIGLVLALNDVISFGITKEVFLQEKIKSMYWLIIPTILYGLQIWLFYYGLKKTSMSILNITWNLISNVLVTILGIYYFGEKINDIKTVALMFAFVSISLFAMDSLKNG